MENDHVNKTSLFTVYKNGWRRYLDYNSNHFFFHNELTNETTWDPIIDLEEDTANFDEVPTTNHFVLKYYDERCIVCGGWGKDLVRIDGYCDNCFRLKI